MKAEDIGTRRADRASPSRSARTGERSRLADTVMITHGPEVFDRGDAAWLQDRICPRRILVAGVMGRTAAEESGLAVEFCDAPPSSVIRRMNGRWFLANHGKTPESGRIFGEIVASRLQGGMVQVEFSDASIYLWNGEEMGLARELHGATCFPVRQMQNPRRSAGDEREIRGCIPGEAVFVNGVVVGTATSDTVVLHTGDGHIQVVRGMNRKEHGIEKLERGGCIDLGSAWCKSGAIRSCSPRVGSPPSRCGSVLIIDHCGHALYHRLSPGICGVLSIGDDTTAVCGHICAHLGLPVFGVVDGDGDGIVKAGFASGSVVVRVLRGRDDEVGRELSRVVEHGEAPWEEWVRRMLIHLGDSVQVVL